MCSRRLLLNYNFTKNVEKKAPALNTLPLPFYFLRIKGGASLEFDKYNDHGCRSRGGVACTIIPPIIHHQQQKMKRTINDESPMRVVNCYFLQDDHQYTHFAISFS